MTKSELLSKVSQEAIMAKYLGLGVLPTNKFLSPFYPDTKAGCTLYYTGSGRLMFKDWGSYDYGDCFKVASMATGIESFPKLLEAIGEAFDGGADRLVGFKGAINSGPKKGLKTNADKPTSITVALRDWEDYDFDYWSSRYGLDRRVLTRFGVKALDKAVITSWKGGEPYQSVLVSSPTRPLYGYYMGTGKDGLEVWKTYYPIDGGNRKWRNNYSASNKPVVEGNYQLGYLDGSRLNGSALVITKALKEVMWLYTHTDLAAVAGPSETSLIGKDLMDRWLEEYEDVYLLMDNDRAGQEATKKYVEAYPRIKPLYWSEGKNVTDMCEVRGISEAVDEFWRLVESK